MPTRLYLDTNVFCRPFDDQEISAVRAEADAFQQILEKLTEGDITLISSEVVAFELEQIVQPTKRAKASGYLGLAKVKHILPEETLVLGKRFAVRFKLQQRDALHAASAFLEKSDYFLTCDRGLIKGLRKGSFLLLSAANADI